MSEIKIKKNRCNLCNKKTNINYFECKCGNNYCEYHRFPFEHSCNYDWKQTNKQNLEKTLGEAIKKSNSLSI